MGKKILKKALLFIFFIVLAFTFAFCLYVYKVYRDTKAGLNLAGGIRLAGVKHAVDVKNNYWFGSANPKVTIIEFGDFACPYCQNSYPIIRELVTIYRNDVKLVFKDYPQFDSSIDLAMAARCAGEQGRFWFMHDKLFQNPGISGETAILEAAKQIGIADKYMEEFKKCFQDKKYLEEIRADAKAGRDLGLTGTPTWIVNGYMVKGDIPFDNWNSLITQLIK